jgi:hypothetical protein
VGSWLLADVGRKKLITGVALAAICAVARGLDGSYKPGSGRVAVTHDRPAYTPHQVGAPIPAAPNPGTRPTPHSTSAP